MKEPSIRDIQQAIQTLHNWVNSEKSPDWARELVTALTNTLEQILCSEVR